MKVRKQKGRHWTSIGACALAGTVALAAPAYADGTQASPSQTETAQGQGTTQQLESIVVQGEKTGTASYEAPTQGVLDAGEPQSVIGQHYIENNVAPAENYTDIINIAPSVSEVTPNGPGNAEALQMSIRGFQDGQFNVTFDGIPFQDSNDFTHHSTSYFTSDTIGNILVDRGPGTASQLGYATFGGTVAVQSKDPLDKANLNASAMFGTWNTNDMTAEVDTGTMKNGGRAMLTLTDINTAGAMTNNAQRRKNAFIKYIQPINQDTTVTAVAMYDTVHQNVSQFGTTLAQMAAYGPHYSLSTNPSSDSYYGYNFDNIHTDFEYIGLHTRADGVEIDNKVYTYAYYHYGYNGADANGGGCAYGTVNCLTPDGTFPAGADTPNGTVYGANNVPGQRMYMLYRSWGDMLRLRQDLGPGELRYGVWVDRQNYHRFQAEIDMSNDMAFNASTPLAAVDRQINGTLTQAQPYVEYAWKITPQLVVTPGLKYAYFRRHDQAQVMQKTKTSLDYEQSWSKALPNLDVHYAIAPNWSTYLQAAKGFLAPNENLFYVKNPQDSAQGVSAESTTNYQVGTTWKSRRLVVSGDLYSIDFSNQVQSKTIAGNKIFYNAGGTRYRGAEAEATYYVGSGFSLYGNATYNKATANDTGLQLKGVPKTTGALGLIYNRGAWYASAITKFVGSNYGDTGTDANGNPIGVYPFSSYSVTTLSANYTVQSAGVLPHGAKIGVQVFNVFNKTSLYALAGYTGNNVPLFWSIPGRSVMVNFSVPFN